MNSTSMSLLYRLRNGKDPESWKTMVDVYQPLIHRWLRAQNTPPQDQDDLTQEMLVILLRELPKFEHNGRTGAFRVWLRSILTNRLRAYWRSNPRNTVADPQTLADAVDDPNSEPNRRWDQEHDQHVLTRLLELAEAKFEPNTYKAFRRVALDGASPADVAAELNISVAAVYIARSRVLRRLREDSDDLLDL
jgi:RNA polymerase sigma-70 factor, ECF subfamily